MILMVRPDGRSELHAAQIGSMRARAKAAGERQPMEIAVYELGALLEHAHTDGET
jgi:hypothetical protein